MAQPKLGALLAVIDAILAADRTAPVKQRHTAKRIFERLRDEHGFAGGYTVVKDHVRLCLASARETFVPRPHPPSHGQVDFGEAVSVNWLQHQEIMMPMSIAGEAVEVVTRDRLFHPVREHLDALAWDGTPRLDAWLMLYLGADDTPYHQAIGPRWMISAVARIYIPGCKADCALILDGPQGIRKSSALMAIAKPWFADRLSDLSSKDAAMETRGVWIIEIAELDTMGRAEVSTIKAFMSRTQDRFRPPYGKRLVDLPRQCVFAGSVNPEGGYLKDPTGGRRFWTVVCGNIDISALEQDRDQLWAEARNRFRRNEPWWLETQALDGLEHVLLDLIRRKRFPDAGLICFTVVCWAGASDDGEDLV